MSKYQNILLALDLKEEDDNAVAEKALAIAENSEAKISIVHVVEPIFNYGIPPGTEGKVDQWENELEETAKSQLEKVGLKLSVPANQQYIGIGQIRHHIIQTANKINADLIVVGTHSRHGISKLIMGDTAEDMINKASCDVLAVHIPKNA